MGYKGTQAQLLGRSLLHPAPLKDLLSRMISGVPTFASAIPFVILSAWLSDKYKKRGYVMAVGYTTALIGWIMVRRAVSELERDMADFPSYYCPPAPEVRDHWSAICWNSKTQRSPTSSIHCLTEILAVYCVNWTMANLRAIRHGHHQQLCRSDETCHSCGTHLRRR